MFRAHRRAGLSIPHKAPGLERCRDNKKGSVLCGSVLEARDGPLWAIDKTRYLLWLDLVSMLFEMWMRRRLGCRLNEECLQDSAEPWFFVGIYRKRPACHKRQANN